MSEQEKDKSFISPWVDVYKTTKPNGIFHRLKEHWGEVIFSWFPLGLLIYLLLEDLMK